MNCQFHTAERPGVTLIETILVIALLAAAAVASSFLLDREWVPRRNVTAVTNDTANTLVTARNTAITNQTIVRVRRDRSRGTERLVITEDAGPYRQSKSWMVELGTDVRLRGNPAEIRFSPTGTAHRAASWSITQSRSRGEVNVAPASGQISRRLP